MRGGPVARRTGSRTLLLRLARPWTLILVATGLFQVFRGAPVDGVFFLVVAAVLVADEFGLVGLPGIGMPRRWVLGTVAAVLGVMLMLAPRHGLVEGLVVAAIGLSALLLAWPEVPGPDTPGPDVQQADAPHPDPQAPGPSRTPLHRAGILWAIIAVVACVIELVSFLLGLSSATAEFAHPSISLLLDPALDTIEGRVLFTALWLLGGVFLLRRRRKG